MLKKMRSALMGEYKNKFKSIDPYNLNKSKSRSPTPSDNNQRKSKKNIHIIYKRRRSDGSLSIVKEKFNGGEGGVTIKNCVSKIISEKPHYQT
jgi:hypothetical protein